jgi:hypothetical protein
MVPLVDTIVYLSLQLCESSYWARMRVEKQQKGFILTTGSDLGES